ncbi:S9 family peptidase [Gimibacter soli]|uniref:S9 family peptidase n=1 Tax=Gimibacter soli TaxID=3024400 RepID=A0AAE9XPX7_9PROT|nr:S9 family peptidase [Gimibacter soli]WCL54221.1 S9 family peptidase [Gimibacter soli]
MRLLKSAILASIILAPAAVSDDAAKGKFIELEDMFNIEYAAGPQLMPDGKSVVYERRSSDIMTDGTRINLWVAPLDGSAQHPLLSGEKQYRSPRLSPDGTRLAYISNEEGSNQLYVRWLKTGDTARLTNLQDGFGQIAWAPDGKSIAFVMDVEAEKKPLFKGMPAKPEGAKWAGPAKVIEAAEYRGDGQGYFDVAYSHIYVIPADGGTPRQVTSGDYQHGGRLAWTADGKEILFGSLRIKDAEYAGRESELYAVNVETGDIRQLTDRKGPDFRPSISPDGKRVAWMGFDEDTRSNRENKLYVMDLSGGKPQALTDDLDRGINDFEWALDGKSLYVSYDDHGKALVANVDLKGKRSVLTDELGGQSIGRPYTSGEFVAVPGGVVITMERTDRPADLALVGKGGKPKLLTALNEDLLGHKTLGKVEELSFKSSVDGRDIQFWTVTPPDFDPTKKYPLILEIHGGPFAAYGPAFSAELQAFAAKGYVVVYGNPRGSTSYGEDFSNLIDRDYPSKDYNDLMDAVDATIAKGFIDEERLFVTGGSGGGVLSAWIIGHTDRFRAAAVVKPVINWLSFSLTSDGYLHYSKYWLKGTPWDEPMDLWKHSPLAYVGNVKTPTMIMTGEVDYRTPMSETEQYYQALKYRKIDAAMVKIPGASHGIAARPSNLVQKIGHILAWFERYDVKKDDAKKD